MQHMDIREPLSTLRTLLEQRLGVELAGYQFWLQDAQMVSCCIHLDVIFDTMMKGYVLLNQISWFSGEYFCFIFCLDLGLKVNCAYLNFTLYCVVLSVLVILHVLVFSFIILSFEAMLYVQLAKPF